MACTGRVGRRAVRPWNMPSPKDQHGAGDTTDDARAPTRREIDRIADARDPGHRRGRRRGSLRGLRPSLPDPAGPVGDLRRPGEPRRPARDDGLRPGRGRQRRPDREEAALPLLPRQRRLLDRDAGLQLPLPQLPELGRSRRPSERAGSARVQPAAGRGRGRRPGIRFAQHRLHLHRAHGLHRVRRRDCPTGHGGRPGQRPGHERLPDPGGPGLAGAAGPGRQRRPEVVRRSLLPSHRRRPSGSRPGHTRRGCGGAASGSR